jgi:hypothetical protein
MDEKIKTAKTYAVIEMMGHRKIIGVIEQSNYSPNNLIRVDVLNADGEIDRTEHIGTGSIYCLTEVSEEAAKLSAKSNFSKPSVAWDIPNHKSLPEYEEPDYDEYTGEGDDDIDY